VSFCPFVDIVILPLLRIWL